MMNAVNMLVKDTPDPAASAKGRKDSASASDKGGFSRELKDVNGRRNQSESVHQKADDQADADTMQTAQADAVAEYIQQHKDKSIILMGDFNDSPISYVRRRIAQELTDCYVSTANGPGISYHYSGFYVRIDNIFCSDHWMPYDCHVDNSIKASDHYPVVCLLKRRGT